MDVEPQIKSRGNTSPQLPPFPRLPLEVGPLNPARGWGAVSSPRRVWGEAEAEIEFGAF